jgi:hypothetical protein
MTAPTMPKGKQEQAKKQILRRPFVAGTRRVDKATYDEAKALNASTQDLRTYECDPNGFLGGAYILCEATGGTSTAALTINQDAPFAVYDTITFNDTNNKPIVGPFSGYDLYICNKYGGYAFSDDAKESPVYATPVTASGNGSGNFTFILRLPVEIVHRDGLGALPNKSSSATFDISLRLCALTTLLGAGQTGLTVRTRIQQFGWMDPNAADLKGNPVNQNPPGVQTTQYWALQTYTMASGQFNQRLQGIDSLVRNLVFVLYDDGSRTTGDADFADPFTLQYETSLPVQRIKTVWRHMIGESFGYKNAVETAGGRDYGAYPLWFNDDFGQKPGAETRLGYLPVTSATTLNISGTWGGSGTKVLKVLVNKVVPANGDPMVLTGR